jgi:radical SAM protein
VGVSNPYIHDQRPLRIYWETTRACDLACRHCRASAAPDPDPRELTPAEGEQLLAGLARFGDPLPHLVLTGGDPLKRADLFDLIASARGLGFQVSVAPSATPLLTPEAIHRLKACGIDAISLSLDGSSAEAHDAIRAIPGTYERTIGAAWTAREAGLPFQVNTLVCQETVDDLPAIYEQVLALGAARWSLFFLVTVGRGEVLQPVSPERAEALLNWVAGLAETARRAGLIITTTEAPHLRRIVSERRRMMPMASNAPAGAPPSGHPGAGHPAGHPGQGTVQHAAGIRDGNGILFISHTGEICPSGFLEIPTGNVRTHDVVEVYRTAPLFQELRHPEAFGGRCGACEFHYVCGGSRARAWAATGNPLESDPLCTHEPAAVPVH